MHCRIFSLFMLLSALLISGCARSPAARFYLLMPVPSVAQEAPAQANGAWIKFLPVRIPDYLDRPQIVTRGGSNALEVDEYHRWGGSLADNITAVLAEDLGTRLSSQRVYAASGIGGGSPDYLVNVQLLQVDAVPGERLLLKARWSIRRARGEEGTLWQEGSFAEPLRDRHYETLVQGMSRALGRLSGALARAIGQMSSQPRPGSR